MVKRFTSIGEAMIEMSGGAEGTWKMGFAGDTLNTAIYARALLPDDWRVGYVTALGVDRYSLALRDFVAAQGIETDRILTIEDRRPGVYFIHQEDGERHFTYWRDRSAARLLAEDAQTLRQALDGADLIYLSGITLAILEPPARARLLDVLQAARGNGARIAFDPNIRRVLWKSEAEIRDTLKTVSAVCDIVLPTFGDEAALFDETSPYETRDRYVGWGSREIVVKDGAGDAIASADGLEASARPAKATRVVDATGAGDSFNGAYIASRLQGGSLEESLADAHRVAAICIAHHGAIAPLRRAGR